MDLTGIISLVLVGVLYVASFVGITLMVLKDKDPNVLVTLVTAATTALMGFINLKGRTNGQSSDTVPTSTDPPTDTEEGF